ncbi:MAG: hypothetical protein R2828_19550 [Saprospiraceae bacterium]
MKKMLVAILLIAGIGMAIMGINTFQESTANLNLLGLEISASDKSGQQSAMLYFGLALASLAGSYLVWKKS